MSRACLDCGAITNGPPRCPTHTNPNGDTSYNGQRNRATQHRFRTRILQRDGASCHHCHATNVELQAHHVTNNDGIMLCQPCHRTIDAHAR